MSHDTEPAPYDIHDSPGYRLTLVSRIIERRFEQQIAPLGLTRVRWCVLVAAGEQGLTSPSEIAAYIGIDRTAISRALRALEQDGMIRRKGHDGPDGRMRMVRLTDRGQEALQQAIAAARENARHFRDKLSWYESETLGEILDKLLGDERRDVPDL